MNPLGSGGPTGEREAMDFGVVTRIDRKTRMKIKNPNPGSKRMPAGEEDQLMREPATRGSAL